MWRRRERASDEEGADSQSLDLRDQWVEEGLTEESTLSSVMADSRLSSMMADSTPCFLNFVVRQHCLHLQLYNVLYCSDLPYKTSPQKDAILLTSFPYKWKRWKMCCLERESEEGQGCQEGREGEAEGGAGSGEEKEGRGAQEAEEGA